MPTKIRHNKKRNTAFLYEVLVRELTKSIVNNNDDRKNTILRIVKEHFAAGTALKKELQLYRDLYESDSLHPFVCEKLIYEIKVAHSSLDKKQIFNEQTALINKINKILSKDVFSNFVPNYKNLATIAQILNPDVSIKNKILLEGNLVKSLSSGAAPGSKAMAPIDNIVYSTFVKKFNEQYGDKLLEEQKELLSRYIASFHDNSLNLKIFLNEEIGRLKAVLAERASRKDKDQNLGHNIKRVLTLLEQFSKSEIDLETINQVLKIQGLVEELGK